MQKKYCERFSDSGAMHDRLFLQDFQKFFFWMARNACCQLRIFRCSIPYAINTFPKSVRDSDLEV